MAFVRETRKRRGFVSDSEAVGGLLHEAKLEVKRQQIDAAYKEYNDTASDEVLAEQREWAEMVGPNMFIGVPVL